MTGKKEKSKGGAPKGNQNARKHGFYSKVLSSWQQEMLSTAVASCALDQEINIMRMKIASILADHPVNTPVLNLAVITLARLLRANHHLENRETQALQAASKVISRLFSEYNRA